MIITYPDLHIECVSGDNGGIQIDVKCYNLNEKEDSIYLSITKGSQIIINRKQTSIINGKAYFYLSHDDTKGLNGTYRYDVIVSIPSKNIYQSVINNKDFIVKEGVYIGS